MTLNNMPIVFMYFYFLSLFPGQGDEPGVRSFRIDDKDVMVTFKADTKFYGKYSGSHGGYLLLNEDGTGEYLADYYGYALPSCQPGPVTFIWGFLIDQHNSIVKLKRDYGLSYPIIYESTGKTSFQGCRKKFLVDYLMVRPDGSIGVSSSDDWEKIH